MATYTVESGDTFGEIAQRYGLSVSQLKSINPQKEDIHRLEIGERIIIPGQQEAKIEREPIQRKITKPLPSSQTTLTNPDLSYSTIQDLRGKGVDVKLNDWTTLNPELSYLFKKDPEVGVGRTGTYINVPHPQEPVLQETTVENEPYSMRQLGGEVVDTLEEKIGKPVMRGIRHLNMNVLQKSGGQLMDEFGNFLTGGLENKYPIQDDISPPPVDVPVIQEEGKDPVIQAKKIIDESLKTAKKETSQKVEEILKKIPLNETELKQELQGGVDENLNLQPDPTQDGDVSPKVGPQAIEIAAREASPVVEQTEVGTVSEPPETEEEPLTNVSITDIKKLADERQITPATKDAFDNLLGGGYEFFGNAPIIKKIDKEIETNRLRLQKIGSGQIKPYFGKEDTGKKIMAAIAAGLGAYASAMTGTPNFALEVINDAIDRDLAVQKENLERQRLSIIDQNDYLQQQKADLLAYAGLELDRMSTIASTKNDALKDALDIRLKEQNLVINTGKIEKQERDEKEYEFTRNVMIADGVMTEFNKSVAKEDTKQLKRDFKRFVSGYNVLIGAPNLTESVASQIIDSPSFSETYEARKFIDKDGVERTTQRRKKFSDSRLEKASREKIIDGVVITDEMVAAGDPVDFTKRGIIEQLRELATKDKAEIVFGKKLTPAGLKIVQLDTFLRNYYQRYIMVTGANLTGVEVMQVSDILPRPGRYAIATGNYLKGLDATENLLKSLYVNEVLAYVKEPPKSTSTPSKKSKLDKGDLTYAGDSN